MKMLIVPLMRLVGLMRIVRFMCVVSLIACLCSAFDCMPFETTNACIKGMQSKALYA